MNTSANDQKPEPVTMRVFDFIDCLEYLGKSNPTAKERLAEYFEWELRTKEYFQYKSHAQCDMLDIYDKEMFETFFLLEETFDIKEEETVLFKINL